MSDEQDEHEFHERAQRELVPKMRDSQVMLSLVPVSPDHVDIKFAVELGVAIMLDKPIIACIQPGTKVPDHLVRVADEIIDFDPSEPDGMDKLAKIIARLVKEDGK